MKIFLVAVHFHSSFGWSIEQALKRCGHEVIVFDYRKDTRLRAPLLSTLFVQRMNRLLSALVKEVKPDLTFVAKGELLFPETAKRIREVTGAPLINWFPDARPMAFDNVAHALSCYDYFFTKNPYWNKKLREIGYQNIHFLAHSYDPEIQKRMPLTEQERQTFGSEVSFIGAMYPYRLKALERVQGMDFKIWGPGWEKLPCDHPLHGSCQRSGIIRGIDHSRVINASLINLNLHHYDDIDGLNQRFFDIAGCGGFQLVDDRAEIGRYLTPGKEVVCYRDVEELCEKIRYYLERPDEREAIRENGFRRIRKGNTYDDRIKEIFSVIRT